MIGETLNGRFAIGDRIGKGAMGTVYRAVDQQSGATVAVKVLAGDLQLESEMVARFRREGEALQQLNHPNIVGFVDTFVHNDQQVIVLEFIGGGSLHELIKREGPLSIERVRQIALDLCDALIRAHRLEIVHRDLKPENVLLDTDGTLRLTDFGVARLVGDATRLTGTGTQIGTPYYMAPEAWEGEALDAQADIWSLGVMLYEMLSGEVPFGGETIAAVMNKVLTAPLPDLNSLRTEIPAGLVQIIDHMLARDKAARYQSIREVAADVERGQPEVVEPARPSAMVWVSRVVSERRKQVVMLLGALGFVAVVVAMAPLLMGRGPAAELGEGADNTIWSFDGGGAPGWEIDPAGWQIVELAGDYALRGHGPATQDEPGYSATLPFESSVINDFILTFRYQSVTGGGDVIFRDNFDGRNCYAYVLSLYEHGAALGKKDGECAGQENLDAAPAPLIPGAWHEIALRAVGDQIEVSVDGDLVLSATDPDFSDGALWFIAGYPNGEFYIDDVQLTQLAPQPATASAFSAVSPTLATMAVSNVLFEDDFDSGLSPSWAEFYPVLWGVQEFDGRTVLHAYGPDDGNFGLLTYAAWGNVELVTDFYFLEPSPENGIYHIQLYLRAGDCPEGVEWQFAYAVDVFDTGVELNKSVCDQPRVWLPLARILQTVEAKQWHRVQVSAVDERIQVNLDGDVVIDASDGDTPHTSGRFALVANDGAEVYFDNVRVTAAD